ncbi:MAG: histidinol-phosphate transaminase [Candidatus Omnitrophica bacterium]|nr:histidinol-phosphate transaminase [Candidatus Omnitrophota bacterium]
MIRDIINENIRRIIPYIPGKPIEEVRRQSNVKNIIKLASNENPLGPSPKVLQAIRRSLSEIHRYPDSSSFYLKRKLSQVLKIKPTNIILGNGSDELIDIIIKTFVKEDENIVISEATFLEYKIIANINNRKVIPVPLKNFRYDLTAIKKAINYRTKLIFIANPNNPTGTYVNKKELDDFIRGLPKRVILVLDEAYDLFVDVDDFPYSLNYIHNKNIIILKTFSKAYALAGLRLGYAIAAEEFVSYLEKARQPFNVNSLAQVGGLAALEDREFLKKTRKTVLEGKRYLYQALDNLGIKYIPSVANFIMVDVKKDSFEIFKKMLKYGVIVRDLRQYNLNNFIRVTIGKKEENKKFIEVFKRIIKEEKYDYCSKTRCNSRSDLSYY